MAIGRTVVLCLLKLCCSFCTKSVFKMGKPLFVCLSHVSGMVVCVFCPLLLCHLDWSNAFHGSRRQFKRVYLDTVNKRTS